MASAPLKWLLTIGGTALKTTAKTLTDAINELHDWVTDVNLFAASTQVEFEHFREGNTVSLSNKVNKEDVLDLEEINASTSLTNKVASAESVKEVSDNFGGISFYEDGEGNKYAVGADSVPKKLGSATIYYLGTGRSFNISNIVGANNVGKYGKNNFIVCSAASVSGSKSTYMSDDFTTFGSYAYATLTTKSGFTVSYDNTNGQLTITGGVYNLHVKQHNTFQSGGDYNFTPVVYFIGDAKILNA